MKDKLPEILIFLRRTDMQFFDPKKNYTQTLNIPATAVKDLEVLDANSLNSLIKDFLEKEKIYPSVVLVIISESVSFTHTFPLYEENKKEILTQDFTDSVPLESPEVKIFKTPEMNIAIAVNPRYYETITETLIQKGFHIAGVIPESVIPEISVTHVMTLDSAKKIIANFDKIRFHNFIDIATVNAELKTPAVITTSTPKGPRIYILIGILVLGGLILVAMLLLRR